MNSFGKIVLILLIVAAIFLGAYFVDSIIFDKGDEALAIPEVGIKKTVLEPTFVTEGGQPVLFVYVKGDAREVRADVAKRVAPTKGGDILNSYTLDMLGDVSAESVSETETGEWEEWGAILNVPSEAGQYLITVEAIDQAGVSTKFKMFDYIMSVQDKDELKALPGNSPGQSTLNQIVTILSEDDYEQESLDRLMSKENDMPEVVSSFIESLKQSENIEVVEMNSRALDLENGRDEISFTILTDGEESSWEATFAQNGENRIAKWSLVSLSLME